MHQYYLYQHRREDTKEVFYVGIGMKTNKKHFGFKTEFERAHAKSKRTQFWKNIASKTKYTVEIVIQSNDVEYIKQKEIELIKIYGRRCCDERGTLVNFQEGGERHTGPKNRNIRVSQVSLSGEAVKVWDQLADIQKATGWLITNIVKCCRGKQLTAYGYNWIYTDGPIYEFTTSARKKNTNRCVGIIATNRVTSENVRFRTMEECALYFGMHRTSIHKYLTKGKKHKTHTIVYKKWSDYEESKSKSN